MFQVSLNISDPNLLDKELQSVLEKDIKWVEWIGKDSGEILNKVESFCRENGIIMTVVDDYEILKDKKYHGILFTKNKETIDILREELGGHPIIGVKLDPGEEWKSLRPKDVDYIVIDMDSQDLEKAEEYINEIHSEWDIPIVGRGTDISSERIEGLLSRGFNGICFMDSEDLKNIGTE